MNDRQIMEGILLTTKGVCDLYMHGAIESDHPQCTPGFQHRPQRHPEHAERYLSADVRPRLVPQGTGRAAEALPSEAEVLLHPVSSKPKAEISCL